PQIFLTLWYNIPAPWYNHFDCYRCWQYSQNSLRWRFYRLFLHLFLKIEGHIPTPWGNLSVRNNLCPAFHLQWRSLSSTPAFGLTKALVLHTLSLLQGLYRYKNMRFHLVVLPY